MGDPGPPKAPPRALDDGNELSAAYSGWRVVAACGVGAFCATIPLNTFGVFLPVLCDTFSWSREAASTAYGSLTLAAAVSAPLLGRLLDRIGARPVVLICLAVSGCAVASLSAMTSSLWHFRAVFAVVGLAMMGASPIAYSRAIFSWFDARRGRALGLMLAGAALSGIACPPVAQALIRLFGWRVTWLLLGATTLLIGLPIAAMFIRERDEGRVDHPPLASAASATDAFRSRSLWTLVVVVFCSTVAANAAIVHMVALLVDRGVPGTQAALTLSAMGAASLLGRILTGWLLDRFAPVGVAISLLAVASSGAFVLANAHSLPMGVLAGVCLGFGSGGETDVIPYLLSRYFDSRSLSMLYGINWTAWGLAGAAGPIVMGRAFDATGSYSVVLFGLGAMTLVAAGLMLTLPTVLRRGQSGVRS
jgi:MFS family permease